MASINPKTNQKTMSKNQDFYGSTNVGANVAGRIVTKEDIKQWEMQRQERKRKKIKLNPYRY